MKHGQVHEDGKVGMITATPTKLFSVDSFDLKSTLRSSTLRPEGAENITLGFQVSDLCFKNPNCIRNPKMGLKQSITDPPQ